MTNQETLVKYLSDMHAAETHFLIALQHQVKDDNVGHFPSANSLLQMMVTRTESRLSALEVVSKSFGADPKNALKDTVTKTTGAILGLVGHGRTHEVTKMLRDDYTTLALLAVGYELLHATGNALAAPQIASLALSNLGEVAGFLMKISPTIIPIAVEELSKTNQVESATIELSNANIKNAWRSA